MTIRVRLFARLRELAGDDSLVMELPEGSTIADLRHLLGEKNPNLAGLLTRCAVAVEEDFAEETRRLHEGCEVAFLPPVSGG